MATMIAQAKAVTQGNAAVALEAQISAALDTCSAAFINLDALRAAWVAASATAADLTSLDQIRAAAIARMKAIATA